LNPVGTDSAEFIAVTRLEDLEVGRPHGVVIDDQELCLLRTFDDVLVFDDSCPHRGHPLSQATCEPGVLRCALHGWEFSIPEGEAISPRAPFGLNFHQVRIIDNVVEVRL
jgi:nitrite reductase/ring-hydroxylating ferredoxin subunit